ncbi:NAD-dependent epimerase/dehydratase family protein [Asanoa ferruginea]|uniref:NAD-dependent epimerase/dehydratase family protein n=1 Tax=Asanoa ferruginea TaxID=53367 RepID=A0A3D9ZSY4_9ACTN|nr:NAD(P)-dependent oxidoreductase [Asanoa ferruginea]REG00306.1 NAD-dependent epimerase/dehydratase family protein [Asanoa ferruginea]
MILLTGGLGFIGSHTAAALRDLGADVLLGQRRAGPLAVRVDCTDLDSLRAVGARHQVTGIVHLAAAGLDAGPVLDKLWADTLSLFNVLRVAQEWDVQRVVLASTIGVYAGVPDGVFREDLPLPLASPHAIPAAKKVTEVVAGALDGLPLVCARIGAIWGAAGPDTVAVLRCTATDARGGPKWTCAGRPVRRRRGRHALREGRRSRIGLAGDGGGAAASNVQCGQWHSHHQPRGRGGDRARRARRRGRTGFGRPASSRRGARRWSAARRHRVPAALHS